MQSLELLDSFPILCDIRWRECVFKGDIIQRQGDLQDHIYFVLDGMMKLCHHNLEGRTFVTNLLFPGDFLGVLNTILPSPILYDTEALTDVEYSKIPCSSWGEICQAYPLLEDMAKINLQKKMAFRQKMMISVALEKVEQRFLRVLHDLGFHLGQMTEKEITFSQLLSRRDLADVAGTTVETAIRTISRLKKEGFMLEENGEVTLYREGLAFMGEEGF